MIALCGLAGLRLQESVRLVLARRVRGEGPCRNIPDEVQDPIAKVGDNLSRPGAMARVLPQFLRPGLEQRTGKVPRGFRRLAQFAENPTAQERFAPRILHIPFRLALQREFDGGVGRQHPRDEIHGHYKGLATKAEAKKWFNVRPSKNAQNVIVLPKEGVAVKATGHSRATRMSLPDFTVRSWDKTEQVFSLVAWREREQAILLLDAAGSRKIAAKLRLPSSITKEALQQPIPRRPARAYGGDSTSFDALPWQRRGSRED